MIRVHAAFGCERFRYRPCLSEAMRLVENVPTKQQSSEACFVTFLQLTCNAQRIPIVRTVASGTGIGNVLPTLVFKSATWLRLDVGHYVGSGRCWG